MTLKMHRNKFCLESGQEFSETEAERDFQQSPPQDQQERK